MNEENKQEKFPRFENGGSIQHLKQFEEGSKKGNSIFRLSFNVIIAIIILTRIFNFISTAETIIFLIIVVVNFIVCGRIFQIIMLNNFYTQAKIRALEDEIE